MPKIIQKILGTLPVPVANEAKRVEFVRRLDQSFEKAKALEARLQAIGDRVDRSLGATLASLFHGELASGAESRT